MTEFVTHDVKRFILEKPRGYEFQPGQATRVSIDRAGWRKKKRPFTFTSRNKDLVLELTIKTYPEHKGVTRELHLLKPGSQLLIEKPFGTIRYEEKGVFLAGGAGITPFVAILRDLKAKDEVEGNRLVFANKAKKDIILEKELREMFSADDLFLFLSREEAPGYRPGRVGKEFLKENFSDFSGSFYVCGPPGFEDFIISSLEEMGIAPESITFES